MSVWCLIALAAALHTVTAVEQMQVSDVPAHYLRNREMLISEEAKMKIGGNIVLSAKERLVDKIFLQEKKTLIEQSRFNRTVFVPMQSFFKSKSFMESTMVFKAIRQMPKGAVLHTHDVSSASLDWVISNVTYRDNLYYCLDEKYFAYFRFSKSRPSSRGKMNLPLPFPDCEWKLLKSARDAATNVQAFDYSLKKNLSLLATDPLTSYVDDNAVWDRFMTFFTQIYYMISYVPVFRDYFHQVLTEFHEDNVQYMEIRAQLKGLFDLEETVYGPDFTLDLLQEVVEEFKKEHPDFLGAKVIYSGFRHVKEPVVLDEVKLAMRLHEKYPNFMIGYDLVGQEPSLNSLMYYMEALLYPSMQDPPFKLPYFFHAAETTWQGTSVDYNLVDAVLLNSTRIGHGYALDKHPLIGQICKERGIAVEVNPISNQVLRLVEDIRNHPMVSLLANDYPLVISSDDCMAWESLPLTHDFYIAFMDMSGQDQGLAFLKQLALNSLKYSVLTPEERERGMEVWTKKWDTFIETFLSEHLDLLDGQATQDTVCETNNKQGCP